MSIKESCLNRFPKRPDICDLMTPDNRVEVGDSRSPRDICSSLNFCPQGLESWQKLTGSTGLDVRVAKALGSRGYDKVRVSVVSNHSISSDLFSYSSQFKYRWTTTQVNGDMYLNSGIVQVNPGQKTTLSVEGQSVDILIPKENEGVRGVIIADPCFTSQWIVCAYKDKFNTFSRMTELLNAMMAADEMSFFQILGDNFYDQTGDPSSTFFNALSQTTKSKIFATVPGNHDMWVHGTPDLYVSKDQQGNGFMQFYGMDAIAASHSDNAVPYDFSVDPDGSSQGRHNLPSASNFFFYNKVGNVAFIAWSGAHSYDSQINSFTEACTWASSANADAVVLLTHWNGDGMGCDAQSTAPAVYAELAALPACAPVAHKMKYFMGHQHCNKVTAADVGFMVGALGMSDSSCGGVFGFPILDTTGGQFKVYYFPIAEVNKFDNYDTILSCVRANGVSGCYHLATLWSATNL